MEKHQNQTTPVFLFVSKSDEKYFDLWFYKHSFMPVQQFINGTIYIMTPEEDVPGSFKEAKEKIQDEMEKDSENGTLPPKPGPSGN